MLPVIVAIVVIAIAAVALFRWFEHYRYGERWRHSEFRGWAFGFLMWFGGLFGHRLPPPPQTKVEFATKGDEGTSSASAGPPLSDDAPDEEQ